LIPKDSKIPFDVRDIVRALVDDSEFFEVQELFAPNAITGFARIEGETVGIMATRPCSWPACWTSTLRQDRPLHPLLRRLQHPPADADGHPGLPAGLGPGTQRRHPPRRQGALCLQRGERAEDHRDPAQGLRRRLHRHVLAPPARRLRLRLADGRDRRDGPEGAANIIFRSEIMAAENPEEMRKIKVKEYTDKFANPTSLRRAATSTR
jgi:Acetyl-CoA carboxylase, carboxyltransferase component (subunits alpha and beta)